MANPRPPRGTKLPAPPKDGVTKRGPGRPKKVVKGKAPVDPRPPRRGPGDVETEPQRSVAGPVPPITSAPPVTFVSAPPVTVVSAPPVTVISAPPVTLPPVSAPLGGPVVDPMFGGMDRDVLVRLLTTLISSPAGPANVSAADPAPVQTTAPAVDPFVTSAPEPTTGVGFEDLDDVLAREQERRQNLELEMMNHGQRRVTGGFSFPVSGPTRGPIPPRSRAPASPRAVPAPAPPRTPRNRRTVVETETGEASTAQPVVEEDGDDPMDENDEGLPDCVKCCRVPVSCRRVAGIACARCARQKQACIPVRFRSAIQEFLSNYIRFQLGSEKLRSNWRTLGQRSATGPSLPKFLLVSGVYSGHSLRRGRGSGPIERAPAG